VRRVIVATGASDTQNLAFYQKRGFRLYDVVRDVFVPANGYPEYAAASTRDQVWLDLEIGPKR
jgi:hypothetical protein